MEPALVMRQNVKTDTDCESWGEAAEITTVASLGRRSPNGS